MGAIDRALREHKVKPLPLELKIKLYAIPLRAMREDLNPKIFFRRGVQYFVAALAVAFLAVVLPPEYQFWPRLLISTGACSMVLGIFFARKRIATSYE
jgi:hypothetical protein